MNNQLFRHHKCVYVIFVRTHSRRNWTVLRLEYRHLDDLCPHHGMYARMELWPMNRLNCDGSDLIQGSLFVLKTNFSTWENFEFFRVLIGYSHATVNLSNSVIMSRWSLNSIGVPRSSFRGAMKIRHVPIAWAPVLFSTLMLYEKSVCCKWVNRAKTFPRGTKSRPRDKSTSDCCQYVWNVLAGPLFGCTWMLSTRMPG